MHIFLVCAYKSQDFAQNLKKFARSHDRVTVTYRNSVCGPVIIPDFALQTVTSQLPTDKLFI